MAVLDKPFGSIAKSLSALVPLAKVYGIGSSWRYWQKMPTLTNGRLLFLDCIRGAGMNAPLQYGSGTDMPAFQGLIRPFALFFTGNDVFVSSAASFLIHGRLRGSFQT